MPGNINLLPKEPKKTKEVEKATRLIKNATYFIAMILTIVGPLGGLSVYKFTRDFTKLKVENETLRSSIANLESTEQGLVLLKDRVGKIQTILGNRQSIAIHAKQVEIIEALPDGLTLSETELKSDVSRVSLLATSSKALAGFLKDVSSNNHYLSLILSDLSFNHYLGFTFDLQVF